ncbi:outer membrane lipoprotein chaperone LolA [Comamonas endophytica]|uniref:Outer-membrane lipoprotein carrier protein n=1 Tax=Comamonas endophytica TaxID=2949090 RepID=A0ABY6GBS8_9BURK|nr:MULTISPECIES: outer membrane lipoprotein chaperone LolA [unclassified Acidovorax]MCD2513119.1 outer membrane lipoprotein chaperone LolA [Acidovorax sp. D4N7]UYG52542.1 outer membrane lipoprotein chaperone LolA [Acidovorax sp. 5MLIR]
MKRFLTGIVLMAGAGLASADGLQRLEAFMQGAQAGRAEFTQTVTSPAKDGQAARSKTSSGEFSFQRPGRFKFDYRKPFEQLIVADGKTLWMYDADLNQVTQRAQAKVLDATPAAILASAANVQALRADFDLKAAPDQDGLEWVLAVPKARDGQLQSVRVGFAGEKLAAIDMIDSFGQRSLMRFTNVQTSASLPAETFRFVAPKGADVLTP